NDCGQPQKVQKLLTQNGILDWTPNQANNTNILSTDLIGNKLTMTGYFGPFGSLSVTDNYYNDINELNGISQNFNLGLATATTDYQGITDILEVKNGAKLGINADMNIGFSSGPASATNSTLYVHVCNQNLTINSTSSLVIGGTQRIGIVTIKGGTNLILKTGSTLEIKANSSLVLEAGAKLIFEKGAIIKLNSTTSIIIVKHGSKIQIGKDAEFNYSGDGFIRFETNNLVTIPAIEAIGQNAQFKLIGGSFGSTSKKLMEITGSGTLADLTTFNSPAALYNLRTFSIQNGNIVLDADSRIVIGGTTTIAYFRSLVIKAAIPNTSNGKHRGIVVNGQSGNSFYKVNITDAKTGITSNNFYGGSDITMLEITATRCERAIFIWGAGANLNNVRIDNCGTAIDLLGMSRSTRLYKIELYYNSTGINALNCVNNIIELYDPRIWSNYYGLYGDNSQFTAKCGIIKNCSSSTLNSSSKYNGANVFLTNNANLTLDPVMRPGAGKIDMSNLRSVSVRQSLASYGPYINQSASSLYTNIDYSIVGTLSKRSTTLPVYPSLPSDNNLWGYTSGVSRSAISLVDYNTEYQYGSLGSRNVDYIDFFPISAFTSCYPNTTGGGGDEERMRGFINGIVTPIKDLPNRQLADGSMIKEKIQEGYNYFFDMSPNYQQSVNNLIYALNAEFTTTELLDWNIAIPIINSQLIEALSEGLNEGNISKYNADSTGYSETVQNTVNLQDKLLANFSNDAELTFSITLAKASLLRMLGNRALSIQVLNAPIPNLSTEMNNIKSSYICMTTKEKMLLDGTFTPTDIDTINNCVSQDFSSLIPYYDETENGNEFTKKDNNSNSTSFISFPIKIYPNPSYGTFNVKFKGIEATEYSIEIVDIIGKKVYNSQGIILLDNNIQLDLSYLNAGTYFMKMVNGKDVQTKQLVIVK
ncbi:MAG: T9SS type A sorting domain-containing protein, partial [Bacteroidia bacterium]